MKKMYKKMYKLWNKQTLYEIYFRPLGDFKVEVITYFSGDPFVNPRSKRDMNDDDNVEIWDIQDARDNWNAWTIHGGYEVSEVEDYLMPGSMNLQKRKTKNERTRRKKQRVKAAMTGFDKLKRMNQE